MTDTILNALNQEIVRLDLDGLLALARPDTEPSERELVRSMAARPGVAGIVCYENSNMSSPELGRRQFMAHGLTLTYKSVEEIAGGHLGAVPSVMAYPVAYWQRSEE